MEPTLRAYLVDECQNVAARMRATRDPSEKMYFFSALWAAPQRVFNIEYDAALLHLHVVALWVHGTIAGRFAGPIPMPGLQIVGGMSGTNYPPLQDDLLEALANVTESLAERISADTDYTDLVERLCAIGYATTGNGNYLLQAGRIPF